MITKDEIKNFGEANNWRGISDGTPIKEAYKLIK